MKLQEKLTKKTVIIGSAVLVVLLAVVIVLLLGGKEEAYRNIKVYEISGNAWVTREDKGQMDMYANMQLQSGDKAETGEDTYVQLKLDEDKYVLLEPETCIQIVARGNAQDSETKIVLEKGAIVNSIENKLSANSSYEVETPSSTMAVRGTVFRITVEQDENGKLTTKVEVHDGSVECRIAVKNQDGTISESVVTVEAGKQISVQGVLEGAEEIGELEQIVYTGYEREVLNFIGYSGETVTEPEADSSFADQSKEEQTAASETKPDNEEKQEKPDKPEDKEKSENSTDKPAEQEIANDIQNEEPQKEEMKQNASATENASAGNDAGDDDSAQNGSGNQDSVSSDSGNNSFDNNGSGNNDGAGNASGDSGSDNNASGSGSQGNTGGGDSTGKQDTYTVTFKYDGKTFATQSVANGGSAKEPVLKPTTSGVWMLDSAAYDFGTSLTQDVELVWNAG